MHIPSKRPRPSKPLPSREIHYDVSVVAYNKETGKWETVLTDAGAKAASYIEREGHLELFQHTKPDDILEFTENGIYKKTEKGWISVLSPKEIKEQLPHISKVISAVKRNLFQEMKGNPSEEVEELPKEFIATVVAKDENNPEIILHVRVVENINRLIGQVEKQNPELAIELSQRSEEVKELRQSIKPGQEGDLQKLAKIIEQRDLLVEAAKGTLLFSETIEGFRPPQIKRIGKGKAKEVFIKKGDPHHAFYTAVPSLLNSKEAEIREEVRTAKSINYNLFRYNLLSVFSDENTVNAILKNYRSLNEFFRALDGEESTATLAEKLGIQEELVSEIYGLRNQMRPLLKSGTHLATDFEEVTGSERIGEKYTVKTSRAKSDLEYALTEETPDFRTKIIYCKGILEGMRDLHLAGYVQGDLKLENVLVLDDNFVEITDFGKTRVIREGQQLIYVGNGRFAAPEGKLTKKSEVFGTGLMLIRVLEEGLLDPKSKMIKSPAALDFSAPPEENRRGIERLVVLSKECPQTERNTVWGKMRLISRSSLYLPFMQKALPTFSGAEREIHSYIDALIQKLQEAGDIDAKTAGDLGECLKAMTLLDPSLRPTMQEARDQFNAIAF